MKKKEHKYKLLLEHLESVDGGAVSKPVELEFSNHDNIFSIIERIQADDLFGSKEEAMEFAIGLKLFGNVMVNNRDNEIFKEMFPAFGAFMKKLKARAAER